MEIQTDIGDFIPVKPRRSRRNHNLASSLKFPSLPKSSYSNPSLPKDVNKPAHKTACKPTTLPQRILPSTNKLCRMPLKGETTSDIVSNNNDEFILDSSRKKKKQMTVSDSKANFTCMDEFIDGTEHTDYIMHNGVSNDGYADKDGGTEKDTVYGTSNDDSRVCKDYGRKAVNSTGQKSYRKVVNKQESAISIHHHIWMIQYLSRTLKADTVRLNFQTRHKVAGKHIHTRNQTCW